MRDAARTLQICQGDVTLVEGDIRDSACITSLLTAHTPQVVFHLAAESHVDNSILSSSRLYPTRISCSHTILEAIRGYLQQITPEQREAFRYMHVSSMKRTRIEKRESLFPMHRLRQIPFTQHLKPPLIYFARVVQNLRFARHYHQNQQ